MQGIKPLAACVPASFRIAKLLGKNPTFITALYKVKHTRFRRAFLKISVVSFATARYIDLN